jgi:hypothetical protein
MQGAHALSGGVCSQSRIQPTLFVAAVASMNTKTPLQHLRTTVPSPVCSQAIFSLHEGERFLISLSPFLAYTVFRMCNLFSITLRD